MSKTKAAPKKKATPPADAVPVDPSQGSDATTVSTRPVGPPPGGRPDAEYHAANADIATSDKKMMIEAKDLKKHFGKQKVLDGVTFGIPEGEITMIMGPSGTGKSVFLRHVVGLMFPDDGDVLVDGKSVPNLSTEALLELRQNVGM